MAEFFYIDGDRLQGILTFEDFVSRNPSRSLGDIQKWGALRKKWFEDHGYSLPPSEYTGGSPGSMAEKPFHVTQLESLNTERGANGVFRGLEDMEDSDDG